MLEVHLDEAVCAVTPQLPHRLSTLSPNLLPHPAKHKQQRDWHLLSHRMELKWI
jgi:hypothetical protein